MAQCYSLENETKIQTLLTQLDNREILIPEIQRPFVWSTNQVSDFINSLYRGYPVGYLITWLKSDVPVRGGDQSTREYLLIDGQQRMMALWTALYGKEILNKNYKRQIIKISFHPVDEVFEVKKNSYENDPKWIEDISIIFRTHTGVVNSINTYCEQNPTVDRSNVDRNINRLSGIRDNKIGVIELNSALNGETVADIFYHINSKGVRLTSHDYIMSKMAAIEQYNSPKLRKTIDYFCHLAAVPEEFDNLAADSEFADSDYFRGIAWLSDNRNRTDRLYIPTYTDMLRVVFTSEFKRGDLGDLVDRLSNDSAENTFEKLENGIQNYINETNFNRFVMILKSAGFVNPSMVTAMNAVNSAYILFLTLRTQNVDPDQIEKLVRRWFVMSVLTGRYSRAPQSTFGEDIRGITLEENENTSVYQKAKSYLDSLERIGLSDAFWDELPQKMQTSTKGVYFNMFLASQVFQNDKGFLSHTMTVDNLLRGLRHIHHIFPQDYLDDNDIPKKDQNQIANLVVMQGETNISLRNTHPAAYFSELRTRCENGESAYGGINDLEELEKNLKAHCIPQGDNIKNFEIENYDKFLEERRKLMAVKIKDYYFSLQH